MQLKIDKKDSETQHPEIPKGYRVIEDYELLKELRTNEELRQITIKGWIRVMTGKGLRAAGLLYNDDGFRVNGYDFLLDDNGHSRGVFLKIGDLK